MVNVAKSQAVHDTEFVELLEFLELLVVLLLQALPRHKTS